MLNLETEKAEKIPLEPDEHGTIRVAGTRVTLLTVLTAFQEGATPEQIVQDFGELKLDQVYAIITYYLRHKQDVDAFLDEERTGAERIRRESETRFPQRGIRARLLRRREEKGST